MSGNRTQTNRFCRCTGKYKALGLKAQTSQARSVLLRPRVYIFLYNTKPVSICIVLYHQSYQYEICSKTLRPPGGPSKPFSQKEKYSYTHNFKDLSVMLPDFSCQAHWVFYNSSDHRALHELRVDLDADN